MQTKEELTCPSRSKPYQYRSLEAERKEIRLLTVYAGKAGSRVECSLQHISLLDEQRPEYKTVSYVWGVATQKDCVFIDGRVHECPASAHAALCCLRLASEDIVLWIDSICINQEDNTERGQQVAMMSDIYSLAECNHAYLGEADDDTESALRSMSEIIEEASREGSSSTGVHRASLSSAASYGRFVDYLDQRALIHFYENPWFQRLWIFQEVCLAPNIVAHCGQYTCDLLDILRAAGWIEFNHHRLRPILYRSRGRKCADAMWYVVEKQLTGAPWRCFEVLLTKGGFFRTTDLRDKVYAILGIYQRHSSGDEWPRRIVPDYSRSSADVIEEATRLAMLDTGHVLLWGETNRRAKEYELALSRLPSWVSSWFQPWDQDLDATFPDFGGKACGPFRSRITEASFKDDGHCLALQGYHVCTVSYVSTVFTMEALGNSQQLLDIFKEFEERLENQDQQDALAMTVISLSNSSSPPSSSEAVRLSDLLEYLSEKKRIPYERSTSPINRYFSKLFVTLWNRPLFITQSGNIGLGHTELKINDTVAILQTADWPVALRNCTERDGFELVGACYVHGCADGTFVEEKQAVGEEPQLFEVW